MSRSTGRLGALQATCCLTDMDGKPGHSNLCSQRTSLITNSLKFLDDDWLAVSVSSKVMNKLDASMKNGMRPSLDSCKRVISGGWCISPRMAFQKSQPHPRLGRVTCVPVHMETVVRLSRFEQPRLKKATKAVNPRTKLQIASDP